MPDFKFWQPDSAGKYAKARDYPERAREAIQEMHRQVCERWALRLGAQPAVLSGLRERACIAPPPIFNQSVSIQNRQVGDLVFSSDGLAQRGLLLRHLVMPGLLEEGREIMRWTAQTLGRDTFVNIMEQYHPVCGA